MVPDRSINKPPYLLGLLCLIPLVGALVGFALFLYGILRYKDKWLMLIGIGGILFTTLVYGSLFWTGAHTSVFKRGFQELSQDKLNGVVRYIEFYKLEHGSYPDSLQQLVSEERFAPVVDPGYGMERVADSLKAYVYYKIGKRYTVYARGLDHIAGTQDDLYPKIFLQDTSQIGWIAPSSARSMEY